MLNLPDVTIVILDNKEIALSMLALHRTLGQITPGAVHIYTDDLWLDTQYSAPTKFFRRHFRSLRDVEKCMWIEVPKNITTSHMLIMQWDGWVLDASKWNPEFLAFDYVAAPWPWYMNNRVGNGGFSLRSKALMDKVWPFELDGPEDSVLCRRYRPKLEGMGYRWAPEKLAAEFSFERSRPCPTFGFHGSFNIPKVITGADLEQTISLATEYALGRSDWAEKGTVRCA